MRLKLVCYLPISVSISFKCIKTVNLHGYVLSPDFNTVMYQLRTMVNILNTARAKTAGQKSWERLNITPPATRHLGYTETTRLTTSLMHYTIQ